MSPNPVLAVLAALLIPLAPAQRRPPFNVTKAAAARQKDIQEATRINQLAADIHSLADARKFVNAVAMQFADDLPPRWTTSGLRDRIAQTEYRAATNPADLIPEQRVADAWNRYVDEIGAPRDQLVTEAEIHNMRDADYTAARIAWAQGLREVWTVPNLYALSPDGEVADGCRPVEAFKVLWELANEPDELMAARNRVKLGILASNMFKQQQSKNKKKPASSEVRSYVTASVRPENPLEAAERRYVGKHGLADYTRVVEEMIGNLLPRE